MVCPARKWNQAAHCHRDQSVYRAWGQTQLLERIRGLKDWWGLDRCSGWCFLSISARGSGGRAANTDRKSI